LPKMAHQLPKARVVIKTKGGQGHSVQPALEAIKVKIVISRKGVDSSKRSDMASPILPCGCLYSIPIPSILPGVRYADIKFGTRTLQQICEKLKPGRSHD